MFQFSALTNSPLTRAEIAHQSRSAPRYHRWRRIGVRITLILAFTLAWILAGGEFAGALLYRDPDPISRTFGVANILPLTVAVAWHFLLMLQTLSLSANSVAREKQANNWDLLILTCVDARQIVRGKWWATVQRQWRKYALLGLLRAAVIIWFGAAISRIFNNPYFYAAYGSYGYYGYSYVLPMAPSPLNFLIAAILVFLLTIANLPFTAACGVSVISDRIRSSALMLGRAIITRIIILIAFGLAGTIIGGVLTVILFAVGRSVGFLSVSGNMVNTLFDNGFSVGAQWVTWRYQSSTDDFFSLFLSAIFAVGAYLLLTFLLLRHAERKAVRQNANPPLKPAPVNPNLR